MDRIINIAIGIVFTALISAFFYTVVIMRPKEIENLRKESAAAYDFGKQAAQKGLPETVNPYPPTQFYQSQRLNWSMGYLSEKMK